MSRIRIFPALSVIAAALLASVVVVSLAAASPVRPAQARTAKAGPARLKLRKTSRGKILVNGRGYTLYAFDLDPLNQDVCVKIKHCTGAWPLFLTHGKPKLGHGVKRSLVGTIKLGGGKRQVTYAGHALYLYAGDPAPGYTKFINLFQFGAPWPALRGSGKLVR